MLVRGHLKATELSEKDDRIEVLEVGTHVPESLFQSASVAALPGAANSNLPLETDPSSSNDTPSDTPRTPILTPSITATEKMLISLRKMDVHKLQY